MNINNPKFLSELAKFAQNEANIARAAADASVTPNGMDADAVRRFCIYRDLANAAANAAHLCANPVVRHSSC